MTVYENRQNTSPTARRDGFTLIEMLIAVAIFAVCTAALFTTFQVGTRAFRQGRHAAETMQTLRLTVDTIARDLRSIYFETDYGARFQNLENRLAGGPDYLADRIEEEARDLAEYGLEPGFVGLRLKLSFTGGADGLEFARFRPSMGDPTDADFGIERVRYYLGGKNKTDLYRERQEVMREVRIDPSVISAMAERMKEGARGSGRGGMGGRGRRSENVEALERLAREKGVDPNSILRAGRLPDGLRLQTGGTRFLVEADPPTSEPELIAQNVVDFEARFGRYDGEWTSVQKWDSHAKSQRSPKFEVSTEDPDFLVKLKEWVDRPNDNLPAYVRLTIGVRPAGEGADSSRVERMESFIWLPGAVEIYCPGDAEYFDSYYEEER